MIKFLTQQNPSLQAGAWKWELSVVRTTKQPAGLASINVLQRSHFCCIAAMLHGSLLGLSLLWCFASATASYFRIDRCGDAVDFNQATETKQKGFIQLDHQVGYIFVTSPAADQIYFQHFEKLHAVGSQDPRWLWVLWILRTGLFFQFWILFSIFSMKSFAPNSPKSKKHTGIGWYWQFMAATMNQQKSEWLQAKSTAHFHRFS